MKELCAIAVSALLISCATDIDIAEHNAEVEQWRTERLASLNKGQGWLTLTGLFWLNEGENLMGSAEHAVVKFPPPALDTFGIIVAYYGDVSQFLSGLTPEVVMRNDGLGDMMGRVNTSADDNPHTFRWKSIYWTILERSGKYAVRMWDTTLLENNYVEHIPHYPVDAKWKLKATFQQAANGTTISMDDILGMSREFPVAGTLKGAYKDIAFTILALPSGEDKLFLLIEDLTTDIETYAGGRYMYVPRPADGETTFIDFNMAFNPPCVFTEFATCLLPPRQNFLPFEVRAGEKFLEH